MTVRAISRLTGSGRPDAGPPPESEITPPAEWLDLQDVHATRSEI
jgi:hypothetical protein